MISKRCINIDWLELYCVEHPALYPMDAEFFTSKGYYVESRDYGTRQYKQMFTIFRKNEPWIEIRREPVSGVEAARVKGIFSIYSCHIRLHNVACYTETPVIDLENFLFTWRYEVRRIYRLDICLDFERFDKGDAPNDVLQRYMNGRYAKINQSNISAHGRDMWDGRHWNSVSWGNPKSMVSTKFYNKSMELAQPKSDKPYIRYSWMLCDLITDYYNMTKTTASGKTYKPQIWRVEFSIKSSAKGYYLIDTAGRKVKNEDLIPHSLNLYETREQLLTAFFSLASHYFRFKKFVASRRKYDCEDKILFEPDAGTNIYHIDREISARKPSSQLQILKEKLQLYKETCIDIEIRTACQRIIDHLNKMLLVGTMAQFSKEDLKLLQTLLALRIGSTHSYEEDRERALQIISAADSIF